jgi:hypothetical protein
MRTQLREDIRVTRERGPVPRPARIAAWTLILGAAVLLRAPAVAILGLMAFEGLLAPLLARPERHLGPLVEWRLPDSYRESPESLPSTRTAP